jgi:aminoacrylate hydrolase
MPFVTRDGCNLYYEVHGRGAPIMFVAGLGGVSSYWKPQVQAFSASHQVIVYDQRGSGKSDHKVVESIEQMADDTLAILDELNLETVHFVGHSTGGAIGQSIAMDHPERLRTLTINSSTTRSDPYRRRVMDMRETLLRKVGPDYYAKQTTLLLYPSWWINAHTEELHAEEQRSAANMPPPDVQASRLAAIVNFDRGADYCKIKTPTLVICARDDILTPSYFSEELAHNIAGSKLVMFDLGGHACSVTQASAFNQEILSFWSE